MQNRVMKLRKRLSATQRGKSENETEKKKERGKCPEGEARAMSLLCFVVVYCCKIQLCGRCQTCPNYVRVCVCLIQLMHVPTPRATEEGERTAAYKKGHATATPTVNKSVDRGEGWRLRASTTWAYLKTVCEWSIISC